RWPVEAVDHTYAARTERPKLRRTTEEATMSKERIKISDDLYDIMPSDYQDLVKSATYGKEDRGWKDIGNSKELIEQHSLCAGCPESMAFRYILASLPNPEDTVIVGRHDVVQVVRNLDSFLAHYGLLGAYVLFRAFG